MKPKLFITRKIPERGLKRVMEHFEVDLWPDEDPPPKQVIADRAREVDALVPLLTDPIDSGVMDSAPNLRIISQYAVGYDNIDVRAATRKGIYVTNTPGVLTDTVADFTLALLFAIGRRVAGADKSIKAGKWKVGWHPLSFLGTDLYEATLGIIGMGRIGAAVTRRAVKGFKARVLYCDVVRRKELEDELGVEFVEMERVLRESDFVSVHVPLSPETKHLIGEKELKLMKQTAYLINTSRGKVIDEKALTRALKEGWIAGAALDVFHEEPTPADNPLLQLDNVVVTPHIASASFETRSKMADIVADNLIAFKEGREPPTLVNRGVKEIRPPGF